MIQYLVTTNLNLLPEGKQIVMVDGTVPGWAPRPGDLHFDHHRPEGALIQCDELVPSTIADDACIVTTQLDADACVAAAWLQLQEMPPESRDLLRAIAYDCDHLGCPPGSEWDAYRGFAAKAVAAMKESSRSLIQELGLPPDRKEWSEEQKVLYASVGFERGTQWLMEAAAERTLWPGQAGEADAYFLKLEQLRPQVEERCYLYRGVAVGDFREIGEYVDPRLLVDWARKQGSEYSLTLTIRDGTRMPNAYLVDKYQGELYSYTLGSIPLHEKGSPLFSQLRLWNKLADLEAKIREDLGLPETRTFWGGRNEVGGSSWRDPMVSSPFQVLDCALDQIYGLQIQPAEAEVKELIAQSLNQIEDTLSRIRDRGQAQQTPQAPKAGWER